MKPKGEHPQNPGRETRAVLFRQLNLLLGFQACLPCLQFSILTFLISFPAFLHNGARFPFCLCVLPFFRKYTRSIYFSFPLSLPAP